MRVPILISLAAFLLASCHGGSLQPLPEQAGHGQTPPPVTSAAQAPKLAEVGQIAPDFTLEDTNGNMVSLSDFRGTPVLIEFWASWCPFCMEELPGLQELYEEMGGAVEILAIDRIGSLGENREQAHAAADRLGLTMPVLFDENEETYKVYRFAGNPSPLAYYIDKNGVVVDRKAGPKTIDEVRQTFDEMLRK